MTGPLVALVRPDADTAAGWALLAVALVALAVGLVRSATGAADRDDRRRAARVAADLAAHRAAYVGPPSSDPQDLTRPRRSQSQPATREEPRP